MPSLWFVRSKGKVFGPYAAADLKRLAQSGKIAPSTEVANASEGPWKVAAELRGLFPQQPSGPSKPQPFSPHSPKQHDTAALRALCGDVDAKDFYIPSDLKPKQLAKICEAFNIPSTDLLVGLLDATIFKTGTRGIAICTDGVRWKNDFSVETTKSYLSWQEFQPINPGLTKEKHVDFGNAMVADISDTAFPLLEVVPLLMAIKDPRSAPRPESARAPQSPRRPRRLVFAYAEAAGATAFAVILCLAGVGLARNAFWPKEKIVEKVVYVEKENSNKQRGDVASASRENVRTPSPAPAAPTPPPPAASRPSPAPVTAAPPPQEQRKDWPEHRLIQRLVGRWTGVWEGGGESGSIDMTLMLDDEYNTRHASEIRGGSNPRLVGRFRTNGHRDVGDAPFTCSGNFNDFVRIDNGRIFFSPQNAATGKRMLFDVLMNATGEELAGRIIGCPGGLGRVYFERQQ